MRRRSNNNLKLFALFGLVFFLAIGYAVVNSVSLSITGTTNAAATTLNVSFTGEYNISNSTKGAVNVSAGATSATFAANNMTLNEKIVFTYTVKNYETDIGARINAAVSSESEFFSVLIQEVATKGKNISFDLAPASTTKIQVIVQMVKTPLTTADSNASHTITLSASAISSSEAKPSVATTIKFSIRALGDYTARAGMTWEDYVYSDYNTDGFTISGDYVLLSNIPMEGITKDDVIVSGETYNWEGCCFDAGSQVLMADGTTKNIEDVKVGDIVMSLNEDTGEFIKQKVAGTIINERSTDLVYVYLSNGVRIGMRAYHPLLTTEGWKSLRPELSETIVEIGNVEMLEIGDTIIGYEENVTVVSIEQRPEVENYPTYNLTIEGYHNYIVEGVVVHNKGCVG